MTTNDAVPYILLNEHIGDRRDAIRVSADGTIVVYSTSDTGRILADEDEQIDVDLAKRLVATFTAAWDGLVEKEGALTIGIGSGDGQPTTKRIEEGDIDLRHIRAVRDRFVPVASVETKSPKPIEKKSGPYPYLAVPILAIFLTLFEIIPGFIGIVGFYMTGGTIWNTLTTFAIWMIPTTVVALGAGAFLASRAPDRPTVVALHSGFLSALVISFLVFSWIGRFALVLVTAKIPIACVIGAYAYARYKSNRDTRSQDIAVFSIVDRL